ncbi:MAG: lysophospholipid acyltransferase family protein [Rhodobacteraceae bacterium]|nr:lysophospholipid acyltransferase family protein [Paracoccaceae bacterium]
MPGGTTPRREGYGPGDWLADAALQAGFAALRPLPYGMRVATAGRAMRAAGRLGSARRRIRDNLRLIWPDLAPEEARRIEQECLDNFGRTFMENFATSAFIARASAAIPQGPGIAAIEDARAAAQPVIFVSGHFGNHQAARACLNARGFRVGGLYRPMNNGYFNDRYVRTVEKIGTPVFPRGVRGTAGLIRHIRAGGMAGLLIDQHAGEGEMLDFLGQPARTMLSAAEMALKYGALLVPLYGTRAANGLDFAVEAEAPIPASTPRDMTQALNDSLAARVRADPGQWFWLHRRWKG